MTKSLHQNNLTNVEPEDRHFCPSFPGGKGVMLKHNLRLFCSGQTRMSGILSIFYYIKAPKYLIGGLVFFTLCLVGINAMSVEQTGNSVQKNQSPATSPNQSAAPDSSDKKLEQATFGTGCFWCSEAVFDRLKGVEKVVSGYSGGRVKNPTYEQVSTGQTGHAEVVQVTYDPAQVSFSQLLEVFWKTHDPTTLNRQGNDVGTQYRSVIFYHNDEQRKLAEQYKQKLNAAKAFHAPIVTEITAFQEFFPAEDYHQDYYRLHGHLPYCQFVIRPKIDKLEKVFGDKLKAKVREPAR
jgi:peptide-methionine (S)-S-oxide reductase